MSISPEQAIGRWLIVGFGMKRHLVVRNGEALCGLESAVWWDEPEHDRCKYCARLVEIEGTSTPGVMARGGR